MLDMLQNDISPLELLQSPVSSKLNIRCGRQRGGPRVPWFHQRNPNETFWDPRCTVEKRMCLQPATCSRCCHETFLYQVSYILSYFILPFQEFVMRLKKPSYEIITALFRFMHCMRPEASKEATTAANVVGPRVGQQRDAVAGPQEVQPQRPHRMQNHGLTWVNQVVADEAVQDVNVYMLWFC